MPTGISIHIGVNHVSERHYGEPCTLYGCEGDARAMHALAQAAGFEPQLLLNEEATSEAVLGAIECAAPRVGNDGILLVTYSGHGGRVPDRSDDPEDYDYKDKVDETWCLHDRELIDDELYACWTRFAPGARVLVVSDSCFSGGVIRDDNDDVTQIRRTLFRGELAPEVAELVRAAVNAAKGRRLPVMRGGGALRRALTDRRARKVYHRNQQQYDELQAGLRANPPGPVHAQVMVLSASAENETAADGDENGLFTGTLLEVWNNGAFQGDYLTLCQALLDRLVPRQTPLLLMLKQPAFKHQRPFTI